MITKRHLRNHIRKCKLRGKRFDFLGYVENKNLHPDVEKLFTFTSPQGFQGYDWVNGNEELDKLIKSIKI